MHTQTQTRNDLINSEPYEVHQNAVNNNIHRQVYAVRVCARPRSPEARAILYLCPGDAEPYTPTKWFAYAYVSAFPAKREARIVDSRWWQAAFTRRFRVGNSPIAVLPKGCVQATNRLLRCFVWACECARHQFSTAYVIDKPTHQKMIDGIGRGVLCSLQSISDQWMQTSNVCIHDKWEMLVCSARSDGQYFP